MLFVKVYKSFCCYRQKRLINKGLCIQSLEHEKQKKDESKHQLCAYIKKQLPLCTSKNKEMRQSFIILLNISSRKELSNLANKII